MRKTVTMYFAGCLFALPQLACGADVSSSYSESYQKCIDEAGNTNAMLSCVAAEQNRWNLRLSNASEALLGSHDFSANAKALLSEAQKLWDPFQNKWCDAYSALDIEGGTGYNLAKADCTLKMTVERALELEDVLHSRNADRPSKREEHRPSGDKSSR